MSRMEPVAWAPIHKDRHTVGGVMNGPPYTISERIVAYRRKDFAETHADNNGYDHVTALYTADQIREAIQAAIDHLGPQPGVNRDDRARYAWAGSKDALNAILAQLPGQPVPDDGA